MGFPRQEYWTGLPYPSPGDLPDSRIEPRSPALARGLVTHAVVLPGIAVGRRLARMVTIKQMIYLRYKAVPAQDLTYSYLVTGLNTLSWVHGGEITTCLGDLKPLGVLQKVLPVHLRVFFMGYVTEGRLRVIFLVPSTWKCGPGRLGSIGISVGSCWKCRIMGSSLAYWIRVCVLAGSPGGSKHTSHVKV